MTEQDPSTPSSKKNIAGELILPVGALAFTIYYIFTVIESPWTAQVNAFMVGSISAGSNWYFPDQPDRHARSRQRAISCHV